ncbi:MAG: molybdate ABC transporter substrate-binding protein [Propionibacteriaceae bacterium]|jgi:molybdate transport system substrate-binding protein|nr:molybdate ABC transporter substrate-binding protein [Propionibacteriaceae bacterium]
MNHTLSVSTGHFLRRFARAPLAALALALSLTACAGGPTDNPATTDGSGTETSTGTPAETSAEARELLVLAAASLTESFTDLGRAFEAAHPGVSVSLSFDGSSTLVTQIQGGAPADVFASADQANMDKLVASGEAVAPITFAANSLVVAVPAANPAGVGALSDLADPNITTVVCAPEVPCGAAAQRVFAAASLTVSPASLEQNVKAVLTKVALGEADAGLVYATDAAAAGADVAVVALPDDPAVAAAARTTYPIVALQAAPQAELAQAFVDYILGPEGQAVLAGYGFLNPAPAAGSSPA